MSARTNARLLEGAPASRPVIDVDIRAPQWRGAIADAAALCRRATRAALRQWAGRDASAEIAIVLGDDRFVHDLNREWRGIDRPTNVLAFPGESIPDPDGAPCLLGDVVVAFETVADEASRDGKSLADHLSHLIVHGVLHLLGYDHDSDDRAAIMEALEIRILGELGIADPYGGPDGAAQG